MMKRDLKRQARLFKIEHGYRDLIKDYLNAQANGQIIPGPQARKLFDRGLTAARESPEPSGLHRAAQTEASRQSRSSGVDSREQAPGCQRVPIPERRAVCDAMIH